MSTVLATAKIWRSEERKFFDIPAARHPIHHGEIKTEIFIGAHCDKRVTVR